MKTGKKTIIRTATVAIITAILLVPSAYAGSRGGHNGGGDRGHNEHRQERQHGNGHQYRGHGYERHHARHYRHNNYAGYGRASYRHTIAVPFPPLPPIPFFSVRVHR